MKTAMVLLMLTTAAMAAEPEPTLMDLPSVLKTLRGCTLLSCELTESDVWVTVNSRGEVTIFYSGSRYGDKITGAGSSVSDAIQSLAAKLSERRSLDQTSLNRLGPYLPTQ